MSKLEVITSVGGVRLFPGITCVGGLLLLPCVRHCKPVGVFSKCISEHCYGKHFFMILYVHFFCAFLHICTYANKNTLRTRQVYLPSVRLSACPSSQPLNPFWTKFRCSPTTLKPHSFSFIQSIPSRVVISTTPSGTLVRILLWIINTKSVYVKLLWCEINTHFVLEHLLKNHGEFHAVICKI